MRRRILLMFSGLLFLVVAIVFAQGRSDTQADARAILVGGGVEGMSWSEIAAMLSVVAGVSGALQWIFTRIIVQPQIEKAITKAAGELMRTCIDQFLTKYKFDLHQSEDILNHKAINEAIQQIVEHHDEENERLSDVRERVRVLESLGRYRREQ